ncbi:extended synaptotagmin-2-like [Scomber japonicus]|uniref:extended synaptotagmin-2-like n=1 Tax=Scomber japonicus TaxID=13676 RepID=UPI002305D2B6|nr:extended synaptotagmin-2-like [Scomber japonicus]
MIDMSELEKEQRVDEWFVMDDVATGKLHLKLEWLSLLPTPDKLDQALLSIKADRGHANDGLSSCVLVVFLDSARNLPSGKKVTSDPSPFVQFRVGHKSFDSKTRYKTNEPVWEEAFTFLIHNPKSQELEVEVKDEKHECSLGTLTLPLSQLLEANEMTLNQRFPLKNSGPSCTLKMKIALRVLCLNKDASSSSDSTPSSVQVRKSSSSSSSNPTPRPSVSSDSPKPPPQPSSTSTSSDIPRSASVSAQDLLNRRREAEEMARSSGSTDTGQGGRGGGGGGGGGAGGGAGGGGHSLAETGRSHSNLAISGSLQHLAGGKEPTPSIASDISNPYAAQELQQRLQQLQNGSGPSHFPLGEVQLTVRHSSQRNKLIVVVHACRFEFSVSLVELHRRTLDVAVKNGGGLLSKHKGLLGKVLVDLTHDDITKGWTQWYELSEDGATKLHHL